MILYLDTNALVKRCLVEEGSADVAYDSQRRAAVLFSSIEY